MSHLDGEETQLLSAITIPLSLDVTDSSHNTCPMAELVTASDCYPTLGESSSEGREFEPHWGSNFFEILMFPFPAYQML